MEQRTSGGSVAGAYSFVHLLHIVLALAITTIHFFPA